MSFFTEMSLVKNNIKALQFLITANDLYERRRYCEALLSYNHSLCYAVPKTRFALVGYAKRSLIYFDLKEYDLCLANIELAIENHNLDDEPVNFDDLKSECIELMKTHRPVPDEDPLNFFRLSHPPNVKLPHLSECLELRVNEKFGRHLITTRDLAVGDIVAVTDFSFIFFDKRARLHHCSQCTTSATKLNLIPCTGCAKGKIVERSLLMVHTLSTYPTYWG